MGKKKQNFREGMQKLKEHFLMVLVIYMIAAIGTGIAAFQMGCTWDLAIIAGLVGPIAAFLAWNILL